MIGTLLNNTESRPRLVRRQVKFSRSATRGSSRRGGEVLPKDFVADAALRNRKQRRWRPLNLPTFRVLYKDGGPGVPDWNNYEIPNDYLGVISGMCCGAGTGQAAESKAHAEDESFKVVADQFADIQVLRYQAPGFDQLTLQQKKLAYFLTEAGLAGRDIFYDQKYRHNLLVRKTIEGILRSYKGNKQGEDYQKFLVYAKRVFFGNGIHHHYSKIKLDPGFSVSFFRELVSNSESSRNCRLRANQWMNSRGF